MPLPRYAIEVVDREGHVAFTCPICRREFKLPMGQVGPWAVRCSDCGSFVMDLTPERLREIERSVARLRGVAPVP